MSTRWANPRFDLGRSNAGYITTQIGRETTYLHTFLHAHNYVLQHYNMTCPRETN
jgi:hypothetical protein